MSLHLLATAKQHVVDEFFPRLELHLAPRDCDFAARLEFFQYADTELELTKRFAVESLRRRYGPRQQFENGVASEHAKA